MKKLTAITASCMFFFSAFVAGKGPADVPEWADSLRSVYLYTEAVKRTAIEGDSAGARRLFNEALQADSTFAPAYFHLAANGMYDSPEEAVELARRAWELDSTNKWYRQFYGQTLIYAGKYAEALNIYRSLSVADPGNPDNYRLVAALYEQTGQPFAALVTLDSAEVRFGRIPLLSQMKRQLLVATHQLDKAVEEARAMVAEAPYEARLHVTLADLYAMQKKDSLAEAEYARAMEIDSTDMHTLMSLADYYNSRRNYASLLSVTRRLYESDQMPLATKISRFEQLTSDIRFYREYYLQINDLARTLAIRYPRDERVVELYAGHLIASGEIDRALELYKQRLSDRPPVEKYYHAVIDIENYLHRPDSAKRYIAQALELFPEKVGFRIAEGNTLIADSLYAEGIRAYKRTLRYARTDSVRGTLWGIIGDAWQLRAQAEKGKARKRSMAQCYDAYDRSLSYLPDNPLVLNNYAYFLSLEERDLERALDMAGKAISLTDNVPTYLDTYGWVLFKLGRTAEAKKALRQAVALDSRNSPELMVHYGDILHALGERFMAETYWRKALENGYDAREIERRFEEVRKEETKR